MADKNQGGTLDLEEVTNLLKSLNIDMKKDYVKHIFDKADIKNSKWDKDCLDCEEFVQFYHYLARRPEMEDVFWRYSGEKGFLNVGDLLFFLKESQKVMNANEALCRHLIELHEPHDVSRQQQQMTIHGFRLFLTSENQQLFDLGHRHVYQDMTRPITHYFIASSHNTYLTGDQLIGSSTVEAYIEALTKGCRCVELDCWDGDNGEPIIYHGYTFTSKILFRDVITAIKDYAFKTTPYPLILSLENHCTNDQQKMMAKHMTQIFGDMLWYAKDDLDHIPSPHELRWKVIIKGNPMPSNADEDEVRENDAVSEDICENTDTDESHGTKKLKFCTDLSRITGMTNVGFIDPKQALTAGDFLTTFSLAENTMELLLETDAKDINRVSHYKLLRIYPDGTRVLSSNFNPVPMWNHGCQILALNYQTGHGPMQLNHGRFLDNGQSGYVLKPTFLVSDDMFGVVDGTVERSKMSKTLTITIISGCNIPKPNGCEKGEIIDPYVEIELHGVQSDNRKQRTKTVNNNGFNPYWNETFSFNVRVPELALLRFVVKDDDWMMDDFLCFYALPFMSVQQGYRHFPVYDKSGNQFPQTLIFTHISILPASRAT